MAKPAAAMSVRHPPAGKARWNPSGGTMITKALLARFESRTDNDDDVRHLLVSAQPLVASEPATAAWFALRFGRGDYGIFDVFTDEAGREAHLTGAVARALMQ